MSASKGRKGFEIADANVLYTKYTLYIAMCKLVDGGEGGGNNICEIF